ncbi:MAG: hypothetical protein OXU25_09695 [Thaumarchaeota archaeon]|nr:hypothetical protein [Nitrososphaerota archaeon]
MAPGDAPPLPPSAMRVALTVSSRATVPCVLKRHLSPATVGLIARSLPLSGNAHRLGGMVYVRTGLSSGTQRRRTAFRRGDIAFWPQGGCVCFVVADMEAGHAMDLIGAMDPYAGELDSAGAGDVLGLAAA